MRADLNGPLYSLEVKRHPTDRQCSAVVHYGPHAQPLQVAVARLPYGTVQTPRFCQPLTALTLSAACIAIVFAPAKLWLNVSARFSVSVLPAAETDDCVSAIS